MRVTYIVEALDTADTWAKLAEVLGDGHPEAVQSTIRHLRVLDVKSYVIEDPYIDRDYSADYLQFYARTFRTYPRHCKRGALFLGRHLVSTQSASVDGATCSAPPSRAEQLLRFLRNSSLGKGADWKVGPPGPGPGPSGHGVHRYLSRPIRSEPAWRGLAGYRHRVPPAGWACRSLCPGLHLGWHAALACTVRVQLGVCRGYHALSRANGPGRSDLTARGIGLSDFRAYAPGDQRRQVISPFV